MVVSSGKCLAVGAGGIEPRALILDCDGVIADSEAWWEIWRVCQLLRSSEVHTDLKVGRRLKDLGTKFGDCLIFRPLEICARNICTGKPTTRCLPSLA